MNQAHEHNRRAWDDRARRRLRHTRTATDKDLASPLKGLDPEAWLGAGIQGRRVLCLAAGGGLQGLLCAAAGAVVTVVDLSPAMLELDRRESARRGLKLATVAASMDDLSMLPGSGFDLVLQPVSTCYVPDVAPVYREVARVLAPGGLYISQHKQPVNLQLDGAPTPRGYVLGEPYFRSGPLPAAADGLRHREAGTLEFLHRWEQLLGLLCRSGFVIEDLSEPRHEDPQADPGTAPHRYCYAPPYIKIKARRRDEPGGTGNSSLLWTPGT